MRSARWASGAMQSICLFVAAAIASIGLSDSDLLNAQSAEKQDVNTKYVLDDSFLFVSVNVAAIRDVADKDADNFDFVMEKFQEYVGFDLSKLDSILIQFGSGGDDLEVEDGGDSVCIVLNFAADADLKKYREYLLDEGGDFEEEELGGKPYLNPNNEYQPGIYFPDDQTMMIAEDARMQSVPDTTGGTNAKKIAGRLNSRDHVGIVFEMEEGNEGQFMVMDQIFREFDLEQAGLDSELLEFLQRGSINIDLKSDDIVKAEMVAASDSAAESIVEAAKDARDQLLDMIDMASAEMESAPNDDLRDAGEKIIGTIMEAADSAKFSQDGSTVRMTTSKKGGATELVDTVVQAAAGLFRMFESFGF